MPDVESISKDEVGRGRDPQESRLQESRLQEIHQSSTTEKMYGHIGDRLQQFCRMP